MNIEDALLTRQVLNGLKGSDGKSHGQLANECHVSQRRMTHHLFCLEKAGLVMAHGNAKVTLSDDVAKLVFHHASYLEEKASETFRPSVDDYWGQISMSLRHRFTDSRRFMKTMFGELFGG